MNALPQIVRKDGPTIELPREEKAYAFRVEAKTLRRVEQRNRTQDVELRNRFKLVDLEEAVLHAAFKKQRVAFKKRMIFYNKTVTDLNGLRNDRVASKTFITELPAAPRAAIAAAAAVSLAQTPAAAVDATSAGDRAAAAAAAKVAFDLEALGSVRRRTKPVQGAAAVCRALADLKRLQRKNLLEFDESMESLHRLELETGMTVNARIPARTYTPPESASVPFKPSAYLTHLRRQVATMERELKLLEAKRGGGAPLHARTRSAAAARGGAVGVRRLGEQSDDEEGDDGDDHQNQKATTDAGGTRIFGKSVGCSVAAAAEREKRMVTFDMNGIRDDTENVDDDNGAAETDADPE